MAGTWCRAKVAGLVLSCLLGLLAIPSVASGDWVVTGPEEYTAPQPLPPFTGDIIIEATGSLTLTGYTGDYALTLPGSVRVCGHLTLNNCALRFTPTAEWGKGLNSRGVLDATDTEFATVPQYFEAYVNPCAGSATLTTCRFSQTHGVFNGTATNTITNCDATKTYSLEGQSSTTIEGGHVRRIDFGVAGDTCVDFSGLSPGPDCSTVIQSSNSPYHVALSGVAVELFGLYTTENAGATAPVTVDNCVLCVLDCNGYSRTEVHDSDLGGFNVNTYTGRTSPTPTPVNVAVQGLCCGDTPITTSVTSDNSPFSVGLVNTIVRGATWYLGDSGSSSGSANTIADSVMDQAAVVDHSSLQVTNSTLEAGVLQSLGDPLADGTAQLNVTNSLLEALYLQGTSTEAVIAGSQIAGPVSIGWVDWGRPDQVPPPWSAPTLTLESCVFEPNGNALVSVEPGVAGARILGNADISPSYAVSHWAPGSTIIRQYPVRVLEEGVPLAGVTVVVRDVEGNVLDSGVTSGDPPTAYLEVEFNCLNYDSEFRVELDQMGYWGSAPLRFLSSTPIQVSRMKEKLSWTSFEEEHYPWSAFAVGTGAAATWRRVGSTGGAPPAHSGASLLAAARAGEALTGLRLSIPTSPSSAAVPEQYTLRTWANLTEATAGNTSAFIGLLLEDEAKSLDLGLPFLKVGWEVDPGLDSYFRVGGASYHLAETLTPTGWHLVEVSFTPAAGEAELKLDGRPVTGLLSDPSLVGQQAYWAILAAQGNDGSARQRLAFDDASLAPKWPTTGSSLTECLWPYAILKGEEVAVSGDAQTCELRYGNGYPMLGKGSAPGPADRGLWVKLDFPVDYTLDLDPETGTLPPPTRVETGAVVWQLPFPELGEEGTIYLKWQTPAGLPTARADLLVASAVGLSREPVAWGSPRDVLPQLVLPGEQKLPDLWVEKAGPTSVSPGDRFRYQIRVVNRGFETAENVVVRDELPEAPSPGAPWVHGPLIPDAQPGDLPPGGRWAWWPACTLDWGVTAPEITNTARVSSDTSEPDYDNNHAHYTTTIVQAKDPNCISVVPDWQAQGVDRHDTLTYTLECQNVGAGTAYGVYATAELDPKLDDGTLSLPDDLSYDPASRTLLWEVGTLASGAGASTSFSVEVAGAARRARPVIGQATVYFPSVPEETRTNVVANTIIGSFPDVSWDHGALLPVELAYENGIVMGYGDGTYRPAVVVKRDQMAVYIARSLCGGDAHVPSGPAEHTFTDVLADHPFYKYIEYCVAEHIVVGYSDLTYRPANEVNRGQMAAYVARAIYTPRGIPPDDLPGYVAPTEPTFPDVATDHPYYRYIEYIVGAGVVQGYADGTYRPAEPVNRGQMAIYVARAFALPM
jgi:uncharacterized repeat protein (TIGR01451 family)